MIPERKLCPWCNSEKDKSCFSIRRKPNGYTWLRMECKACEQKKRKEKYHSNESYRKHVIKRNAGYSKINSQKIAKYNKEYREENKERIAHLQNKKYRDNCEQIKKQRKEYYRKNPEKHIKIVNEYLKNNKPKVRAAQRKNYQKKISTDMAFKMRMRLAGRICNAVRNKGKKCKRTAELIGCDMNQLMFHLEVYFKEGMNWSNYGAKGWHIDHIKPCAIFDLSKEEDQLKCFHYTNLQPLWWYENLEKRDKISEEYNNHI